MTQFLPAGWAQEVTIPDAALKSAIWRSLGRGGPVGRVTEQDMLGLTRLEAAGLRIRNTEGLADASNLSVVNLQSNQLPNLTLPASLTNLSALDLAGNRLRSLLLPAGLDKLRTLALRDTQLRSLSLPSGLKALT